MDLSSMTPEQRPCVTKISGPLVINAGAGSGKTYTLTQRIAYALDPASGPAVTDIDEVCAITFTQKAAQEIKDRVRRTLRAMGRSDQALKVDGAWISTIHGMCARILRRYAMECNIDPCFEVIGDLRADELLDAAIERTLQADNGITGSASYAQLFNEYPIRGSFNAQGAAEMVRALVEASTSMPAGLSALAPCCVDLDDTRAVRETIQAYEDLRYCARANGNEGVEQSCSEALGLLDDYLADCAAITSPAKRWDLLAQVYGSLPTIRGRRGALHDPIVDFQEVYRRLGARIWIARGTRFMPELISLVQEVRAAYDEAKHAANCMDNNDLLRLTLKLFTTHPAIPEEISRKFKMMMVDEFQDTSKMQVEIAYRLTAGGTGNLCTVGDAQQSIYRFRGADVNVYEAHRAAMADKPQSQVQCLTRNFRSDDAVLRFVARIFSQQDAFGSGFMDLSCNPERKSSYHSAHPRIRLVVVDRPSGVGSGVSAVDVARAQADEIARQFRALADEGHDSGGMVVLLGRMGHAQVFADAIRRQGLEAVITGGSLFGSAIEVQVMSDLAQCLVNPGDTQALFAVLSSEMFGLGADDLVDLASRKNDDGSLNRRHDIDVGFAMLGRQGMSDALDAVRALDILGDGSAVDAGALSHRSQGLDAADRQFWSSNPRLANAHKTLNQARQIMRDQSLSAALSDALVQSGWLMRLQLQGALGLACAGNLLKCVRVVEDIEHQGGKGCAQTAALFKETVDSHPKEAPGAINAEGGSAVRIMTIHASKGLEFPIVAVGSYEYDHRSSRLVVESLEEHVALSLLPAEAENGYDAAKKGYKEYQKLVSVCSPSSEADILGEADAVKQHFLLLDYAAKQEQAEVFRKFYVALTRASECLIVPVERSITSKGEVSCKLVAQVMCDALFPAADADTLPAAAAYGGVEDAWVTHVVLPTVADDEESPEEEPERVFAVPEYDAPARTSSFAPAKRQIFSYSAISGASHHFSDEAEEHAAQDAQTSMPDDSAEDEAPLQADGSQRLSGDQTTLRVVEREARCDDCLTPGGADAAERGSEDALATALGSAFHRGAQYAVQTGRLPGKEMVDAYCRTYGVTPGQRLRLEASLEAWFTSDMFARAMACPVRRAEVPFFVPLADGTFLEGEIDLLCLEGAIGSGGGAVVFDYKTGGYDGESASRLHAKHLLQAQCYAYALLLQGYDWVELHFVRVERALRGVHARRDLETVDYRFERGDADLLGQIILQAKAAME